MGDGIDEIELAAQVLGDVWSSHRRKRRRAHRSSAKSGRCACGSAFPPRQPGAGASPRSCRSRPTRLILSGSGAAQRPGRSGVVMAACCGVSARKCGDGSRDGAGIDAVMACSRALHGTSFQGRPGAIAQWYGLLFATVWLSLSSRQGCRERSCDHHSRSTSTL